MTKKIFSFILGGCWFSSLAAGAPGFTSGQDSPPRPLAVAVGTLLRAQAQPKDPPPEPRLAELLKKAARYSERLSRSALDFVCTETITERIDPREEPKIGDPFAKVRDARQGLHTQSVQSKIASIQTNRFVYDYQLIKKSGILQERQTLLEENGRKTQEKDAPLKTSQLEHQYVVLGPVGLLGADAQQNNDYSLVENAKIQGQPAVVIEVKPKAPAIARYLYGKVWMKDSDGSVLRIEWNEKSLGNYEPVEEVARRLNAQPKIAFASEYGVEKNGLRFPSLYSVREAYVDTRGKAFVRSETEVVYKDYKFFTVETGVELR